VGPTNAQSWRIAESRDRAKDFVGWVQPEALYWRPFSIRGIQEANFKLLSYDPSSRARSQLTNLPPGYSRPAGYHNSSVEIFVLEGDLAIGEKKMSKYSYAYYPAGYAQGPMHSDYGATFIEWWDGSGGQPDFVASLQSKPGTRTDQLIEGLNYYTSRTTALAEFAKLGNRMLPASYPMHVKVMRKDPATGQTTWIVMTPGGGGGALAADNRQPLWTSDPAWQEGYLLEGNLTMGECLAVGEVAGTYSPGGYFFRPAGARYGGRSLWSTSYSLWLLRSGSGAGFAYHDRCDATQGSQLGGGP
jgi:hypothetical protein